MTTATEVKQYFRIGNYTEIESEAFTLIGASTKRDDNTKIGFFGSGLKYALAVLLRNEIDFKIFSGKKEIEVTTKTKTFREQEFEVICIDGKETNLTTDMGVDWAPWFAVREIYCNALDEGSHSIGLTTEEVVGAEGATRFYIEMNDKLKEMMDNWNRYFSDKRADIVQKMAGATIFHASLDGNALIYRKGIQCSETRKESLFDYDLADIDINESRVLKSSYDLSRDIARLFGQEANRQTISTLINGICEKEFEKTLYWEYVYSFSQIWLDLLEDKVLIPSEVAGWFMDKYFYEERILLPNKLCKSLEKAFGSDKIKVAGVLKDGYSKDLIVDPTDRQAEVLKRATDFVKKVYPQFSIPMKVCCFEKQNILGQAKDKTIFISTRVLDMGIKQVVATIFEETFHLESGAGDETREFQDYLVLKVITYAEEQHGEYL